MTSRLRAANIGASTLLSSVSPVLPSWPAWQVLRSSASSPIAAGVAPSDGVKLMYGMPKSSAAMAYSELAESGDAGPSSKQSLEIAPPRRQFDVVGRRLGRRHIDDDHAVEIGLLLKVLQIGLQPLDRRSRRLFGSSTHRLGSQPVDRRSAAEERARPDAVVDRRQLAASRLDELAVEHAALRCSRSTASTSEPSRISWPPTTKVLQSASGRPANCGSALTNPTESVSRFWSPTSPNVAVDATPPRAPMNQMPVRA